MWCHHHLYPTSLRIMPSSHQITITDWNCQGLSQATLYLRKLIDDGSMVIVVTEHWLWPYELHCLNDIHPDYTALAISDKCLSSTSELVRGCGGVAILWHKSLTIIPIDTNSDRFCAIIDTRHKGLKTPIHCNWDHPCHGHTYQKNGGNSSGPSFIFVDCSNIRLSTSVCFVCINK